MKTDFKKTLDSYKANRGEFKVLTVPATQYLMIDGHGDPNTEPAYVAAIEALYPLAYKLKFASKTELDTDYVVPPLEGLWWAEDMASFTTTRDKSQWDWTLMIMTPDWITAKMFAAAKKLVAAKKPLASLDAVRLETLNEGQVVQTLHIGSYNDEAPVLRKLHSEFIPSNSLQMVQKHHEIYLSDLRNTAPDKLKTILRQPVVAA